GDPFDLIYCAHINLMPVAGLIKAACRIPIVLAIYGIDAWQPTRITNCAVKFADLIVSISQLTLDRFQAWASLRHIPTAVVPNSISAEKYGLGEKEPDLLARFGLDGRRVIMTFGRLSGAERYKGFDEVIEVLPRLREAEPNIAYVIAGDGDDRERLAAKA